MTVRQSIEKIENELTPTDQKIAAYLLEDYPSRGLVSIQDLANNSNVSFPSVTRFVTKIGYKGYNDFYKNLLSELKDGGTTFPQTETSPSDADGFLTQYLKGCIDTLHTTMKVVSETQFIRVCEKIKDPTRSIYVIGGSFSDSLVKIFSLELKQIRNKVYHLPSDPEMWPEYVMRMKKKDVFIVVDFYRHQKSLYRLTQMVQKKVNPHIITVTNSQNVPLCALSREVMITPVNTKTPWDTFCATLALFQAISYQIGGQDWDKIEKRIERWYDHRIDNI